MLFCKLNVKSRYENILGASTRLKKDVTAAILSDETCITLIWIDNTTIGLQIPTPAAYKTCSYYVAQL